MHMVNYNCEENKNQIVGLTILMFDFCARFEKLFFQRCRLIRAYSLYHKVLIAYIMSCSIISLSNDPFSDHNAKLYSCSLDLDADCNDFSHWTNELINIWAPRLSHQHAYRTMQSTPRSVSVLPLEKYKVQQRGVYAHQLVLEFRRGISPMNIHFSYWRN